MFRLRTEVLREDWTTRKKILTPSLNLLGRDRKVIKKLAVKYRDMHFNYTLILISQYGQIYM